MTRFEMMDARSSHVMGTLEESEPVLTSLTRLIPLRAFLYLRLELFSFLPFSF